MLKDKLQILGRKMLDSNQGIPTPAVVIFRSILSSLTEPQAWAIAEGFQKLAARIRRDMDEERGIVPDAPLCECGPCQARANGLEVSFKDTAQVTTRPGEQ
jgi:hypothetical protein